MIIPCTIQRLKEVVIERLKHISADLHTTSREWVAFDIPHNTVLVMSEMVYTADRLTDTDETKL